MSVRYDQIRRIPTGLAHVFGWLARDGYPDASPELVISGFSGSPYTLAAVRSADTITAISSDGTEITISTGPTQPGHTLRGIILQYGGHVWIDGGADYQGPARVLGLVSQTSLAATTSGTAVLRLAEPLPGGLAIVSQQSTATGSIVLSAGFVAAASPGALVRIAGVAIESDEFGGAAPGYSGTLVDLEASAGVRCTETVFASRLAACINAAGIGVTATAVLGVVTLTAGHNVTVVEEADGPAASLIAVTSLTGASASWRLRWQSYTVTIPSGHVGTTPTRGTPARWSVDWSRRTGADLDAMPTRDQGLIHIARAPFATGLTDEGVYRLVPGFAALVPQRQTSWEEQRDAALDTLATRLSAGIGATRYVDDLPGAQFARAHALLTILVVLQGQQAQGIDVADAIATYATAADAEIEAQLARVQWMDLDGDGVIDDGETDVAVSKPSSRASWTGQSGDTLSGTTRSTRSDFWSVR